MKFLKVILAVVLTLNVKTIPVRSQTPMFYGWFFNEIVADALRNITNDYLLQLYGSVDEVQLFLKNVSTAGIDDPLKYYTKPLDPNTRQFDKYFHITSYYCGTTDCSSYSNAVAQYLNQSFITHLVGVFFTPRTYGIRVNLTSIQKDIFEIGEFRSEFNKSLDDLYFLFNESEEPCDSEVVNEIQVCPQDDSNFHPTDSRAHVTLGCAPNIVAVTTGLDLIEILEFETEPYKFCAIIQREQGNLIQMGDECDTFVYYLKDKIVANSTFEVYNFSNATRMFGSSHQILCLLLIFILTRVGLATKRRIGQ